jgi:hypothetical protein
LGALVGRPRDRDFHFFRAKLEVHLHRLLSGAHAIARFKS